MCEIRIFVSELLVNEEARMVVPIVNEQPNKEDRIEHFLNSEWLHRSKIPNGFESFRSYREDGDADESAIA